MKQHGEWSVGCAIAYVDVEEGGADSTSRVGGGGWKYNLRICRPHALLLAATSRGEVETSASGRCDEYNCADCKSGCFLAQDFDLRCCTCAAMRGMEQGRVARSRRRS